MIKKIEPAWAILPGRGDSLRLLSVWYLRKSFYWLMWLGFSVAAIIGHTNELDASFDSPSAFVDRLVSPLAVVFIALIVRFASAMLGIAIAYPLAKMHELDLAPRTNFGSTIGLYMDRLHVARAYRSLRWTHHVRQVAIRRLGRTGQRLGRIDPVMDIANIGGFFVMLVVLTLEGSGTT